MEFTRLKLSDRALFESYLTRDDVMWEYNFATLYAWDVRGTLTYALTEGGDMIISTVLGDETVFFPPYLKRKENFAAAVKEITAYSVTKGLKYRIRGLSREQAEAVEALGYEVTTNRDDYDYVYSSDDLISLRGKAFHSKRNFVTRFMSEYEHEFREYRDEDRDGIVALYDSWQSGTAHSTLDIEKQAILRAFEARRELGLDVSVLKADGEFAAFSVCTVGPNDVAHCLFEKGETRYVGIYQAINKLTAEKSYPAGILVNRQEDMGIEGLRKAKLSYTPKMLLEKYSARPKL